MVQAAKKVTQDHTLSLTPEAKSERKTQKNFGFGLDMLPNAMSMCSQLMASTMELHTDTLKAASDYCGGTVRTLCAISSDLSDNSSRSFSKLIEVSQEAFKCRTINDAVDLQQKVSQQAIENCVDATQKLSAQLQEHLEESLSTFQEHTTAVTEKFSKAMSMPTA